MDLRANHTSNKKTDGRIAPRSGLAAKNFIDTGAGVIDADYRGEVKVLLFNFSDEDFVGMFSSPTFCLFFLGGGEAFNRLFLYIFSLTRLRFGNEQSRKETASRSLFWRG